jgi:tetratricopeptide (TPR) repeat protein
VPCKVLDKLIFKDTAVANEIAKQFIVLKYNAERDSIHKLTLKYHVAMYPTTIILNQKRFVVKKLIGIGGSDKDLLRNYQKFLMEAIENYKENKYIIGVSDSTNLIYPKFYEDYVNRKNINPDPKLVAEYWQNTNDLLGEVPFTVLSYFCTATDSVNAIFLANKKNFELKFGKLDVRFITTMMINQNLSKAVKLKNSLLFEEAIKSAKENLEISNINDFENTWLQRKLESENKWVEAMKIFIKQKKEKKFDDDRINSFCYNVFEKCNDSKVLNQCIQWMKAITEKNPKSETLDTYAKLLYKAGNKKDALLTIKKAIKIAKLNKEDSQEYEQWLKEKSKNTSHNMALIITEDY